MKKTQLKDALRNITTQRVSFLSVVVIAMLAVMTYLGIAYAADAAQELTEGTVNADGTIT